MNVRDWRRTGLRGNVVDDEHAGAPQGIQDR